MADSVVNFLVETLGSLSVQEIGLLTSVGNEIMEIKDEFSSMHALLKDADAKEDGDARVKEWVKQVRDVAYETEDVLDDFRLLQRGQSMVHFFSDVIQQTLDEKENKNKKEQLKDMDTNKLKEMLRNVLKGNRYIFVLDDIWKLEALSDLKNAFLDDIGCGSRIIVTTRRFHDIAHECISESRYSLAFELPLLTTPGDTFKLFCKVAFPSNDLNCCPPSLVENSQKFVKKNKGLPLAIVSVAGLLRIKKHVEWNQVYENLGQLMRSNSKFEDLNCIISLSYTDLPFHLKSCFLYLCIFPEDYSIRRRELLQLWVAEGFVERKGMSTDMTMEDIAMGYLDELINRCLVQVESFGVSGRVKTCLVHAVLREFIIAKAQEQGFVTHFDRKGLHDSQVIGRCLSSLDGVENMFTLLEENESLFSHLRSFISFDHTTCYSHRACKIIRKFKLLRVFKVEPHEYQSEETIISHKLSRLRYLSLGGGTYPFSFRISYGRYVEKVLA